jgi:hypothetical protein
MSSRRAPHAARSMPHAAPCTLPVVLAAAVLLGVPSPLSAQIRASERGSVSQTVDGTTITIDYARPKVRGRDSIFGGVVHFGEVWTPGANWATTLTADRNITLNGHPVTAGSYSVWFEVQPDTWTFVLDPEPRLFHTTPPAPAEDQLRFTVQPEAHPHEEMLSWWFADVKPTGTLLRFAWATSSVPFTIGVQPSVSFTVAPVIAEPLLGAWQTGMGADTAGLDIRHDGEHLVLRWDGAPPEFAEMWLIALGEGMFRPVFLSDGEPFDVETDMVIEFTPLDGRATAFEVRGIGDELMANGWLASGRTGTR